MILIFLILNKYLLVNNGSIPVCILKSIKIKLNLELKFVDKELYKFFK